MNSMQFNLIRSSKKLERSTGIYPHLIKKPLVGLNIKDIPKYPESMKYLELKYDSGCTYHMYIVDVGHASMDMYLITCNDRVICWRISHVMGYGLDAFWIMTGAHMGYDPQRTCAHLAVFCPSNASARMFSILKPSLGKILPVYVNRHHEE